MFHTKFNIRFIRTPCAEDTGLWTGCVGQLRRNPIEDGAISGFSGQKSVPE